MAVDIPLKWGNNGELWKISAKNKNEIVNLKDGSNSVYSVDTFDSNTYRKITFALRIKEKRNSLQIGIVNNVQHKNTRFCKKEIPNNNEMKIEENRYYCIDAHTGKRQSHVTNHAPEEYTDDIIYDGDILIFSIDFESESISIGINDDEIFPMFTNIKDIKNENWRLAVSAYYKDNCVELLSCKGITKEGEGEVDDDQLQESKVEELLIEKEKEKQKEKEKVKETENKKVVKSELAFQEYHRKSELYVKQINDQKYVNFPIRILPVCKA